MSCERPAPAVATTAPALVFDAAKGREDTTSWSPPLRLRPAAATTSERIVASFTLWVTCLFSRTATDVFWTCPGACLTVWVTWPTALVIWELVLVYVPPPPEVTVG